MQTLAEKDTEALSVGALCRLIENISEVLYSVTFADSVRMDFVSRSIQSLAGYTAEEVLSDDGIEWLEIVHPDDKDRYLELFEQAGQLGEGIEQEYRINMRDGSVREVSDRAEPVFDDAGRVTGFNGLIVDVTERNRVQRGLDRTQMLQNIGRLAAGIVHEINTPIQFIGDNIRFLSDSFGHVLKLLQTYKQLTEAAANGGISQGDIDKIIATETQIDLGFVVDEIPQAIEQSLDGINRVSSIITAMRDFSHLDERRMAPADLNKALQSVVMILRNELKYVTDVKMDLDRDLPMVMCCVDDMNQVFLNLLINAAHSISDVIDGDDETRGMVTVRSAREGEHVVISISDTGTGIDPEIKDKIFDPFFTTKATGRGTGQGLSIARSIVVEKHHGTLELETEVGSGTTFTIRLPIEQDQQKRKR